MTREGLRDDYQRIRLNRDRRFRPADDPEGGGLPAFVGQVTSPSSAIGVGRFFLVQPTSVLGAESEGGAGSIPANPKASIPVYLLGPGVPSPGDYVICRFVDFRWVAERSAGAGGLKRINLNGCNCPVPPSLMMTSGDPNCNYGMYQTCTLQYQDPPACFAPLNITSKIFLSTSTFQDQINPSYPFYYYLYCQSNQFTLTRLYCTSPYGSPYRDATLYTWLVNGYGNSCDPFFLHHGTPYPGSDATCSVIIDPA